MTAANASNVVDLSLHDRPCNVHVSAEGKALATEAHQVRGRAQAAHAEAALKIEHANNAHKGLGQNEIDLHGLHAVEAVEALDRRY